MNEAEINNKAKSPIEENKIKEVVSQAMKFLSDNEILKKSRGIELSVAFVTKQEIAKLNSQYRQKNEPTDVLSFSYDKGLNGEIVLCYDIIKENSLEDGVDVEFELAKNIIHGILHILEFEHGEGMFRLQDLFLAGGNF